MPASSTELTLFRAELDITSAAMTDEVVNAIFDQAATEYVDYSRRVVEVAAYHRASVYLLNRANRLADYEANEAREKLSQIPAQLEKQVARYKKELDAAIADESTIGVGFGRTKSIPPRTRMRPES